MLAYGRQSISQKESIQLDVLVDEVLKLIQNTIPSNISVKKEVELDLPQIWGMPNEIHQVLLNLCINASGAMKDGGTLTISLKKNNDSSQKGDLIVLSVCDTGKGIESDILERIFDPFFTTKEIGEGSGLGLSVVQGIVQQHGGNIEVDSQVGKGSAFHIYLPVSQKETKLLTKKTKSLSKGNGRVLLVDDSDVVLLVTKRMLENLGYKVTAFLDCIEALEEFSKYPKKFDLVITDYGMPQMNGKQMTEKLKEISIDIPVILYTGYGNLVAKADVSLWKINDLLIKPCNLQTLSDTLAGVLKDIKIK